MATKGSIVAGDAEATFSLKDRIEQVLADIVIHTTYSEHIEYRVRAAELLAKMRGWIVE